MNNLKKFSFPLLLSLSCYTGGSLFGVSCTWTNPLAGQSWNVAGNWSGCAGGGGGANFPNAATDQATFAGAIITPRVVTLGQNITVGGVSPAAITFNNSNAYTISSGIHSLSFPTGLSVIQTVGTGNHIINCSTIQFANGTLLDINSAAATSTFTIASNIQTAAGASLLSYASTVNGTLVLSGTNDYGGDANALGISGGTVSVASENSMPNRAGSSVTMGTASILQITGAGFNYNKNFDLASTGTFDVPAANATLSGVLSGVGGLTKQNSGILILTGASNYAGTTTVAGGTLQVDGSLSAAGIVQVNGGATLSGVGSMGNTTIDGTITPGDSIGTINVADITINGTHINELSPFATDLINASGTVTLGGGSTLTVQAAAGAYSPGTSYVIIQSPNMIMGMFANLNFPAGFDFTIDYSMFGQVILMLASGGVPFPQSAAFPINPRNVANLLNGLTLEMGTDLFDVVNILATMSDPEEGLDQLHPALFNVYSLAQESSTFSVRKTITDRLWVFEQDPCLCSPECYPVWNLWVTPFGGWAFQGKMHRQLGYRTWTTGASMGVDRQWECFDAGIAAAYTYNHIGWTRVRTSGEVQSGYGSLYGSWFTDRYYVEGIFTGAYNHYHGKRGIFFESSEGTVDRTAHSSHNGYTLDSYLQAGLTFDLNCCCYTSTINPFVGFDWLYIHRGKLSEHGADSLNLKVRSQNANLLRSEVGFNWALCFKTCCWDSSWVPEFGLSYVNESRFNGKKERANFEDIEVTFVAFGLNPSRNLIVPSAGITGYFLNDRLSFALNYDAELQVKKGLGKKYWMQEIMLRVMYTF